MNHSDVAVIRGPIDATLTNSEGFRCCYKEMGVGFGPFRAKAKVNIQTAFTCLTLLKQAGLPFTLDVFEVAQILMSIGFNFKATTKSSIVHVVLDNGASVRHSIGCRFAQQGQWGGGRRIQQLWSRQRTRCQTRCRVAPCYPNNRLNTEHHVHCEYG